MPEDQKSYLEPWLSFTDRINHYKEQRTFFKEQADELGLSSAESLLSIGAGVGETDIFMIKNCMSKLTSFLAVEPDEGNFKQLGKLLEEQCPNIKTSLFLGTEEDYQGPQSPVDVVLIAHVIYYVKDMTTTVKRCLSWLKPGGKLIIMHKDKDAPYKPFMDHFKSWDHLLDAREIQEELAKSNITVSAEYIVPYTLNIAQPDKLLLDFFLHKDTSESEAKEGIQMITEEGAKCDNKFVHQHVCLVYSK